MLVRVFLGVVVLMWIYRIVVGMRGERRVNDDWE